MAACLTNFLNYIWQRLKVVFVAIGISLIVVIVGIYFYMYQIYITSGDIEIKYPSQDTQEFLMIGDLGNNDIQSKVLDSAEKWCDSNKLSAIFLLGDNFMPTGVRSVDSPLFDKIFEQPFSTRTCISKLPVFAITGNHDEKGNVNAQILYSNINPRWHMPSRYYSVTFGNLIRFVAINTEGFDMVLGFSFYKFLRDSLSDENIKWKITFGHQPLLSGCSKRRMKHNKWRTYRDESFICDNSHAFVAGHFHMLEHSKSSDPKDCSTDVFISGGGGDTLLPCDHSRPDITQFIHEDYGFLSVKADERDLVFSFVGTDGNVLYTKTKN